MKRNIFLLVGRVLVASIFIFSGFSKLIEPYQNFLAVVYSFDILNPATARLFALIVPWCEFIFGLWFLFGLWTSVSLSVLWLLNSCFIVTIASALFRKLPIQTCGCFGGNLPTVPLSDVLVVDGLLWFLFLYLWINSRE